LGTGRRPELKSDEFSKGIPIVNQDHLDFGRDRTEIVCTLIGILGPLVL
jgi:hypothetical protein